MRVRAALIIFSALVLGAPSAAGAGGPDFPPEAAVNGLCNAWQQGNGNKSGAEAFQRLASFAADSGRSVEDFCDLSDDDPTSPDFEASIFGFFNGCVGAPVVATWQVSAPEDYTAAFATVELMDAARTEVKLLVFEGNIVLGTEYTVSADTTGLPDTQDYVLRLTVQLEGPNASGGGAVYSADFRFGSGC